jgi:serine/threonine protein kinase
MFDSLPEPIGGRYRVIRFLGRGGMGVVYEVEHAHTGARLALKVMNDRALANEAAVKRFRREARISSRIRSEHIVHVIDADTAPELGGAPYLVMELLDGQDLRRLCGETPQPTERVLEWLRQVARGIDKAHALGIIHRDLKPENLFLARREDGTTLVKILDFGVAKMTFDAASSSAFSEILGTPLFMAPEQLDLHGAPVTTRADLFAFGLIAHRLITGRHYWSARLLLDLVREICLQPMPPPSTRGSDLGPAFDAWFARACHRDPAHRFESAGAQVEALASTLSPGGLEPTILSLPPFIAAERASSVRRWRASALRAVVMATALAAGAMVWWSASRTVRAPLVAAAPIAIVAAAPVSVALPPAAPSRQDATSHAGASSSSVALPQAAPPSLPTAPARPRISAAIRPAVSAPPTPSARGLSPASGPVDPVRPVRPILDPFADQH